MVSCLYALLPLFASSSFIRGLFQCFGCVSKDAHKVHDGSDSAFKAIVPSQDLDDFSSFNDTNSSFFMYNLTHSFSESEGSRIQRDVLEIQSVSGSDTDSDVTDILENPSAFLSRLRSTWYVKVFVLRFCCGAICLQTFVFCLLATRIYLKACR